MTQIFGLLVGLFKLVEVLLLAVSRKRKNAEARYAILSLQQYRKRLERALLARRKSRLETFNPDFDDPDGGLPDDGYRRD